MGTGRLESMVWDRNRAIAMDTKNTVVDIGEIVVVEATECES